MAKNGKQMTIIWHVDDLMISHVDLFQITKITMYLLSIYGESLTVHWRNVHDYPGIDLDFLEDGKVKISMIKYLHKVLTEFPEVISNTSTIPDTDHLSKTRDPSKAHHLPEEQAAVFHHAVAQLLFLSSGARCNIQTGVAVLTTCIKQPDENDWGKMKRILKYLYGMMQMKKTYPSSNGGLTLPTTHTKTEKATLVQGCH